MLLAAGPAPASTLPPGFQETTALSGLELPTNIEFAPNGRVFVAEKGGLVKTYDSIGDPTPTVFADLRTQVHSYGDRGFLGLAVDPAFPANPYVYVMYAHDAPIGGTAPTWGATGQAADNCPAPPQGPGATHGCVTSSRISRLHASGDVMTGPEQVLVEDFCDQIAGHGGGGLAFGADGYLYATGGDGASPNYWDYGQDGDPENEWHPINPCGDPPAGVDGVQTPPSAEGGRLRSQDLRTAGDPLGLSGSLIRIDPATGSGVPGNPLFSNPDPNARRMLAHGLRNPFRLAVRPGTNDVWIGDVGGFGWEELNRMPDPGGPVRNFGWPCYEGGLDETGTPFARKIGVTDQLNLTLCENLYSETTSTVAPFWTYEHAAEVSAGDDCPATGNSISALAFYPMSGGTFPVAYNGALLFGDFSRRCIWAMLAGPDGQPDRTMIQPLVEQAAFPVDLELGPGGDMFYVNVAEGDVRRVHFTGDPDNRPPVARAEADPVGGDPPLTVDFDGTASSDPDEGDTLDYEWDLDGDGQLDDSTAVAPSFTYTTAGTYVVTLRVTDDAGVYDTDAVTVYPGGGPPLPSIDTPAEGTRWTVGETLTFSGSATDPDDGPLAAAALDWRLVLHHCNANGCHEHPLREYENTATGSFTTPDHSSPSYLELKLTATDPDANSATTSLRLDPRTVPLTFQTNPPGMTVLWGDRLLPSPITLTSIVGSAPTLSAPSPQTLGNTTYRFAGWLHGQPQTHTLVTPSTPATYTARYAPILPGTHTLSFRPEADASVDEAAPALNRGTDPVLTVGAGAGTETESHLRFIVNGISGKVQSAVLRLRSVTGTADGPQVFATTAPWTETGVTWANRPPPVGAALSDSGGIAAGSLVELDVTAAVGGEGPVSLRLAGASAAADFHSRQAATPSNSPALVVTVLNDAYPRPKGATPTALPLVPAYRACASPNRVHGPPLASGACAPPAQTSAELTVGTADANGAAARSVGAVYFYAVLGDPATAADEADVAIGFSLTDVRRRAGLGDYGGELQAAPTMQITDLGSTPTGSDPATLADVTLPVTVPCTPTGDPAVGSTCAANTSMEAIAPGLVRERSRAIWELGRLEVTDGGPDGDADTAGNAVFATQGIFIP